MSEPSAGQPPEGQPPEEPRREEPRSAVQQAHPRISAGSPEDMNWLLAPNLPPGLRLQFTGVVEAPELTPEVLRAFATALEEVQRAITQQVAPDKCDTRCGKLTTCQNRGIGCPILANCGCNGATGLRSVG
jgi:hypothetical protein